MINCVLLHFRYGENPCPFCGTLDSLILEQDDGSAQVICENCWGRGPRFQFDMYLDDQSPEAIEATVQAFHGWNRIASIARAAPSTGPAPSPDAEREALYRAQDIIKDIQAVIGGVPDGMTTADAVQAAIARADAEREALLLDALEALQAVDDANFTFEHIQEEQALEMVIDVLRRAGALRDNDD